MVALILVGWLESKVKKQVVASYGGWIAFFGFVFITLSSILYSQSVFYIGVVFLGVGTGVSTVSNLSLMLDMTVNGQVGLFIGAWGMANALSRLIGSILGGAGRDILAQMTGDVVLAYMVVFGIMALFMLISIIMLKWIRVSEFQQSADQRTVLERAAIAGDV
jgi:BCD family chlorophyll transporter-like MFS transporter